MAETRRRTADVPRGRAGALGAAATAVALALSWALGHAAVGSWQRHGLAPAEVGDVLTTLLLAGAAVLGIWVAVVLAAATATLLRGRAGVVLGSPGSAPAGAVVQDEPRQDGAGGTTPPAVRLATAALVAAAGLGTTPVAHAGPEPAAVVAAAEPAPTAPDDSTPRVPEPGWTPVPRKPAPAPSTEVGLVSSVPAQTAPSHVVVRRGDSLWLIAARHLGPQATAQDVAEEWPRWYAANERLVGPDPDLILPGQELVVPTRTDEP